MATITQENKVASVKQFNCSGCGSALEVFNPRAKYIACQYCGNVLDNNSDDHQIMMSLAPPEQHKPLSFIRVGLVASFFGKDYQVIARTRWQQDYYEYWSEDGDSGYSRELWIYDEWLMISEQRTYFYLIEDKKGYYISEEIIPDKPSLPSDDSYWSFMQNHREQIIQEYGAAQVIHFEGESNYQIKINDTIQFAAYNHKKDIYLAEWRIDNETNEIKEIEFFKEVKLSKKEVMVAFEANEELDVLRNKGAFWEWMFFGSAASAAVLLVLMFSSFGGGDQTVYEQTFSFAAIDDSAGVITAPINIEKTGLHCIELHASIFTNNTEGFVLANLLDKDKKIINDLDCNFSIYTGYEDGEYYSESEDNTSKLVNVKEAGTYYAQLLADADDGLQGEVRFLINTNYVLTRYYFLGFLLMGILALIFYNRKKKYI
jgi:hypothetical protein